LQVGQTGKVLKDVVAIGIGGSYLGPLFAYTALQTGAELVQLFFPGHFMNILHICI
jgi:glucose-6-phosphate isomerase